MFELFCSITFIQGTAELVVFMRGEATYIDWEKCQEFLSSLFSYGNINILFTGNANKRKYMEISRGVNSNLRKLEQSNTFPKRKGRGKRLVCKSTEDMCCTSMPECL